MKKNNTLEQVNKDFGTNYKTLDWDIVSTSSFFRDTLLEAYKDVVNWSAISLFQHLSEETIEKFSDYVVWEYISANQKLSEDFIRKHADDVDWRHISIYQKLSEDFIEEFQDKVDWHNICLYQKLSQDFISRHVLQIDWVTVSMNQKLSDSFISKYKDKLIMYYVEDNWQYKSPEYKKEQIQKTGLYECHDDYFIAYKGVRANGYAKFNFQYQYEVGKVYEDYCDFSMNENGFGLSVWTKAQAIEYGNPTCLKVKVYYKDVGRLIRSGVKIRCTKIEVLEIYK